MLPIFVCKFQYSLTRSKVISDMRDHSCLTKLEIALNLARIVL